MGIKKKGKIYLVESSSKKGSYYEVDLENKTCTCPAFVYRYSKLGLLCKHIEAVMNSYPETSERRKEEIISYVRRNSPVSSVETIEMFSEEEVEELLRKGELIEKDGMLYVLE